MTERPNERPPERAADAAQDEASPLADPGMRLAARTIDALLPTAPAALLVPAGVVFGTPWLIHAGFGLTILLSLALVIVDALWLHRYGQTVGKRMLGLRIVRRDGARATFGRILGLRILVPGLLEAIPIAGAVFGIVDALFVFSAERRTLHDRIADTIVVDLRRHAPMR